MAFTLGVVSLLLSSLVMLLVAAGLLWVGRHRRAVQVFVLLLVLRGLLNLATSVVHITEDPAAWTVYPLFLLPLPFVAFYFVAVYPAPREWLPEGWRGAALFAVPAGIVELIYAARPSLYWDVSAFPGAPLELFLDLSVPLGPLYLFFGLSALSFAVVAFVTAHDALAAPARPGRQSMLLVGLGFGLVVVDVAGGGFALGNIAGGVETYVTLGLALVVMVALAAMLLRAVLRRDDADLRPAIARYLAVLPLPLVTAVALAVVPQGVPGRAEAAILLAGIWRMPLPLFVAYALVRYQLFDLDVKVRRTVKRSALLFVFLAVFFLGSETAEIVVSEQIGPLFGLGAAVLLTLALRPVERLAGRVAAAVVPGARTVEEMDPDERLDLYREQVAIAYADGNLTDKERRMLKAARERLELSEDEADAVESRVIGG